MFGDETILRYRIITYYLLYSVFKELISDNSLSSQMKLTTS